MVAQGPLTASFRWNLGMQNAAIDDDSQPLGDRPLLVDSTNTRFSVSSGIPYKAPLATSFSDPSTGTTASRCGPVPCGHLSSSFVAGLRHDKPVRIFGNSSGTFGSPINSDPTIPGTGYWPADVRRAGAVPSSLSYVAPATCTNQGYAWFAQARSVDAASNATIQIVVIGPDGELSASTITAIPAGTMTAPTWIGLTSHLTNGVRLWWKDTATTTVNMAVLTLNAGGYVTVGGAIPFITPAAAGTLTHVVTAHNDTFAYLATLSAALATSVSVTRVNVVNNTTVTNTTAVASAATSQLAVSSALTSAGSRIALNVSLAATNDCTLVLLDANMVRVWSGAGTVTGTLSTAPDQPRPVCGFYRVDGVEHVVFGAHRRSGSTSGAGLSSSQGGLVLQFRSLTGTGTLNDTLTLPWTSPCSRVVNYVPSAFEIYPVFLAQHGYNVATPNPTSTNFVNDPAINLYLVDTTDTVACIGRFGVDTAASYPGIIPGVATFSSLFNSECLYADSARIQLAYLETDMLNTTQSTTSDGCYVRYVDLDMTPRQPRYALAPNGSALIAGALPVVFDGAGITEFCATNRPKVGVEATGGLGATIAAGNYLVSAVYQWKDHNGILHRSMPADAVSVAGGNKWIIHVSVPVTYQNSVTREQFKVRIYVSLTNGTILYSQDYPVATYGTYSWIYNAGITQPVSGALNTPIYSDGLSGAPLPAQQPPAFSDIAVIGDRAWGVDAERPQRVWFTKPQEAGVAFEWSSEQTVTVPASAGSIVAVVESNGLPTLLCKNGVWSVTGAGPDAALTSGSFGAPEQVSDLGCTDRGSVVKTPVGVMYVCNRRFVRLGQGAQIDDRIDVGALGACTAVLIRDYHEVLFSGELTKLVYNYQHDKWSRWNYSDTIGRRLVSRDPVSGLINFVASNGAITQLDVFRADPAPMSLTTGWVQLAGPEDEIVITDISVTSKNYGQHDARLQLELDYGNSFMEWLFDNSSIVTSDGNDRYTFMVSPGKLSCRYFRLTLSEQNTTGAGMGPISCTVSYQQAAGIRRSSVVRLLRG